MCCLILTQSVDQEQSKDNTEFTTAVKSSHKYTVLWCDALFVMCQQSREQVCPTEFYRRTACISIIAVILAKSDGHLHSLLLRVSLINFGVERLQLLTDVSDILHDVRQSAHDQQKSQPSQPVLTNVQHAPST